MDIYHEKFKFWAPFLLNFWQKYSYTPQKPIKDPQCLSESFLKHYKRGIFHHWKIRQVTSNLQKITMNKDFDDVLH